MVAKYYVTKKNLERQRVIAEEKKKQKKLKKIISYCLTIKNFYSITEINGRKIDPLEFKVYKEKEQKVIKCFLKLQILLSVDCETRGEIKKLQRSLSYIKNYTAVWYEQWENHCDEKRAETELNMITSAKEIDAETDAMIDTIKGKLDST